MPSVLSAARIMKGKAMISEVACLLVGTGFGIILAWPFSATRSRRRPSRGTTVAEIRARLDRETHHGHTLTLCQSALS